MKYRLRKINSAITLEWTLAYTQGLMGNCATVVHDNGKDQTR